MKQTFYEILRETYQHLPLGKTAFNEDNFRRVRSLTFDNFINNRDYCADFILNVLEIDRGSNFARINRGRLTHIFITWLLGVILSGPFKSKSVAGGIADVFFEQIWLQTAMAHDYGYLRDELMQSDLTIEKLTYPFNLLTDNYDKPLNFLNDVRYAGDTTDFFAYDYKEIVNYFEYRKYDLRNDKHEKNDHGIVGGMLAFKNYCRNVMRDKKWGLGPSQPFGIQQKVACFIAASHNIYKSTNSAKDEIYRKYNLTGLLSTSPIRVKKNNNLLMLLSLVDTLECTKRFSAKENPKSYLQEITTLKYVTVEIASDRIVVDYENLYNYIKREKKNEEMLSKVKGHVDNVEGLSTWTEFKTIRLSDFAVEIFM